MKIRTGFVSNSSSSSFLVWGKDAFGNYALTTKQKALFIANGYDIPQDTTIWITPYLCDEYPDYNCVTGEYDLNLSYVPYLEKGLRDNDHPDDYYGLIRIAHDTWIESKYLEEK